MNELDHRFARLANRLSDCQALNADAVSIDSDT